MIALAAPAPLLGHRLLQDNEVPAAGDWAKWSDATEWLLLKRGMLILMPLPVATIRHRVGQPSLQFCTSL